MKRGKRYCAYGLATAYTGIHQNTLYRAEFRRKGEPKGGWYHIFYGNRKVFECNPQFFKLWFKEVRS